MKRFGAPWGKTLLWMSILFSLVIMATLWGPASRLHPQSFWGILFLGGLWSLLPGAALFTVRGYTVTPDAILVHRLFWSTRLPRAGLVSTTVEPHVLNKSLRICGNGGMYSFTGWYWSKKLGRFRAYVTDLNRTVVLKWEKRTAVVSPDDPEGFVREVTG